MAAIQLDRSSSSEPVSPARRWSVVPAGLAACLCVVAAAAAGNAQTYERPGKLRAGDVLAKSLLQGPDFRVRDDVVNDGLLNLFTIESSFGTFEAVSNARAQQRVTEVYALRQMESIRQSETFVNALKQSGRGTIDTVTGAVTDPVGTVSGAVSGVGKAFARVGDSLFGAQRSEAEGGRLASLIGIEEAKRKFAHDFGVDVYSDNKILQDRLDELARATVVGNLSYSAALSMVPGAAGVAVTATGVTQRTNDIYRSTSPSDLRVLNQKKLVAMGIRSDAADAFVDNAKFSPREQTELVFALERMPAAKRRDLFVLLANLTQDRDMAFFRQRQAEMYAGYHMKMAAIDSFVPFGDFVGARTTTGQIVFNLPVDHLVWTKWMADVVAGVDRAVTAMPGVKGKQLVTTGTLSPMARQGLQSHGWTVTENAESLVHVR